MRSTWAMPLIPLITLSACDSRLLRAFKFIGLVFRGLHFAVNCICSKRALSS